MKCSSNHTIGMGKRANARLNGSEAKENYRAKGTLCDKILKVEQIWNTVIR